MAFAYCQRLKENNEIIAIVSKGCRKDETVALYPTNFLTLFH